MDSKYNRVGMATTNSSKSPKFKFNGFTGVYKPLPGLKKKKKLVQQPNLITRTANSTAFINGQVNAFKSTPVALVKPMPKATLIGESAKLSLLLQRKQLPVYQFKNRITEEIQKNDSLVFLGETGSGKTTQIPQYVFECGTLLQHGICAITQPRRMAAISIAQRVAQEQHCKLGSRVGYSVRFEDMTSEETQIQYMTDGTLLRQALNDRLLQKYSVIVLDEAHERTINTDVLFGLVKWAQGERKRRELNPLRIVIMSATMDADHFANYFNGCSVIYLEGRLFPVKVWHTKEKHNLDYQEICLYTLFNIHTSAPLSEDVLIFLTGQEEIESLAVSINEILKNDQFKAYPMKVFPLYAQLPQHKQLEVFKPLQQGVRKVILSTNIAETSITIKGIKFVIDSGVVKQKTFNPATRVESLKVTKISQAQAWQRTGRAGRESEGTCYRAYTIAEFRKMPRMNVPEIIRSNLGTTVLQLLALEIDCLTFDFLDKPSAELMENAFRLLHDVKAIDSVETRTLTDTGVKMARFPLEPRLSRVLMASGEFGCLEEVLSIVALLSTENVFVHCADKLDKVAARHRQFQSNLGDIITLLNVFKAFQADDNPKMFCFTNFLNYRNLSYAADVRNQLEAISRKCKLKSGQSTEGGGGVKMTKMMSLLSKTKGKWNGEKKGEEKDDDWTNVRKCLLIGHYDNVAQLQKDNTYMTLSSRQRAKIHPSSVLHGRERPELVFYTEFLSTGQNYLKTNTVVEAKWLLEMPQLRKHFGNFLEK